MLKPRGRGFSIIEMMIALVLLAVLISMGAPSFVSFLRNTQIRTAAETTMSGLTLARAEAVRRNTTVRFSLVSDLTDACVLNTSSLTWVVSQGDPSSHCGMDPVNQDDSNPPTSTDPKIVQKKSGSEGASSVLISTTGGGSVTFNGLGRLSAGTMTQLEFQGQGGAANCEHNGGPNRCLRVLISSPGGQVKLCDPKVTAATDPRFCA